MSVVSTKKEKIAEKTMLIKKAKINKIKAKTYLPRTTFSDFIPKILYRLSIPASSPIKKG